MYTLMRGSLDRKLSSFGLLEKYAYQKWNLIRTKLKPRFNLGGFNKVLLEIFVCACVWLSGSNQSNIKKSKMASKLRFEKTEKERRVELVLRNGFFSMASPK